METAGILVIFTIVIVYLIESHRSKNKAWKKAAEHLGLEYVKDSLFGDPSIRGYFRGFPVIIEMEHRYSGKHGNIVTIFRVFYTHDLQLGLNITKTNALTGVNKLIGAQDIKVQDSVFDDLAVIKGDNPEEIKRFLTKERREALRKLMTRYNKVEITDREIKIEHNSKVSNPFVIKKFVENFVRKAEIMVRDPDRS